MAPGKKETSVELCSRVNAQGNTIAIRMLEYLSSAKNAILGFESLATEFIELCQVLWSIESGLKESTKSRTALPVEVAQELDKRVRQVSDEFTVLGQMVNKCTWSLMPISIFISTPLSVFIVETTLTYDTFCSR